jgi:hypothetical protein
MPDILKLKLGPVVMEVPYFSEYLMDKEYGRLPRDLPAHALWYYYILAMRQYDRAKKNLVYEDELSEIFDVNRARDILQAVSNMYGTPIQEMIKYWDAMEKQRIALGGGESLPSEFKFQFSLRN